MEHSRFRLKSKKKIWFQVWNLAKFQTWNRIFFWFCKKSCECSKIPQNYLSWTLSEPIFSGKKKPFSVTRSGAHYHGCRRGCQERGVVVRGTARARLAFLSKIPPFFLSFFFFSFLFISFLFSFLFFSYLFFDFLSFLFFS